MCKSENIDAIYNRMKFIAAKKNTSLGKIALAAGIERKSFYHGTDLSTSKIVHFCRVTGCSADYLFGFSEEMWRDV